ncbi:MAG: hypothetical protein HY700_19600 [Gemmatimonadetes bacterium]|nr:hypothetical protein [Gemmatimonadota bacterium]
MIHFPVVRGRTRFPAGVLLIVWFQVATANMAACALDHALHDEQSDEQAVVADHHSNIWSSAVKTPGDCGEPQLLLVDCVAARPAELPAVTVIGVPPVRLAAPGVVSPPTRIEPPPPRI